MSSATGCFITLFYKVEMRGYFMRVRNPIRKNDKKQAIESENKLS